MMKKFAVIGHPIKHSKSPALHQAGFVEMNIEAEFVAIDVAPENLENWLKTEFSQENFYGAAITIPHKEAIKKFVQTPHESSQKIGAVNTIWKDNGIILGANTDYLGALRALQEVEDIKDKNILVIGAGGAARAIIYGVRQFSREIFIANRTLEKAVNLTKEFDCQVVENILAIDPDNFDIIINTTSVGLKENASPFPAKLWRSHHTAFDIVYDPLETKFLFEAEQAGAKTITGDKMLVYQALAQFKIWHNIDLESEIMMNAFFE
jgi:shikimate dehydrogenase